MSRSIPHILRYLLSHLRYHQLQALRNTLAGLFLVVVDPGSVWATKLAIDIATGHSVAMSLPESFLLIAAIMVLRISLVVASRWIKAILGVKAQNDMRLSLFSHLLRCKWLDLRTYHTGNLTRCIARFVTDVAHLSTVKVPSLMCSS